MLDPIVLLTPFLVLVVILLLGFAGCYARVYGSWPYPLSVVVRVPTTLTATLLQIEWVDPEGDVGRVAVVNPAANHQEDRINVFSRVIQAVPSPGHWSFSCVLTVREDEQNTATGREIYDFDLVPDLRNANFKTSGKPSDQNFDVMWDGAT